MGLNCNCVNLLTFKLYSYELKGLIIYLFLNIYFLLWAFGETLYI